MHIYLYVCVWIHYRIHGIHMGFLKSWGIPKTPWISILSHGLMTLMIGGTPIFGSPQMVVGPNHDTGWFPKITD